MLSRLAVRTTSLRHLRLYSEGQSSNSVSSTISPNVPGLSSNVIRPATGPVGPGVDPQKTGPYKVPEYFCYTNTSFFDAEIEMAKYRLTPPSAVKAKN